MLVFLLSSPILAYLVILGISDQTNQSRQFTLVAAIQGFLFFIPGLGIILLLRLIFPLEYDPVSVYRHYLAADLGGTILGAVLFILVFQKDLLNQDQVTAATGVLSFLVGYLTAAGLVDTVLRINLHDVYTAFLLPIIRIVFLILVPPILSISWKESFMTQKLAVLGLISIPVVAAVIPTLFTLHFRLVAAIGTVLLIAGALVLYGRLIWSYTPSSVKFKKE